MNTDSTSIHPWLRTTVARLLDLSASDIDGSRDLRALALDSVQVVRLAGELEAHLDVCAVCQGALEDVARKAEEGLTAVAVLIEQERRERQGR